MQSFYSFEIYCPEIPENYYSIRIKEPPAYLPDKYNFLKRYGRDWKMIVLAEDATGFVRFTNTMDNPTGRFLTNLWSLRTDEAIKVLELPKGQSAEYKHRVKVPSGTTIMVGRMTSSETIQFYLADTAGIEYCDSRNTNDN